MKLVYYKLNDYDQTHCCFPLCFNGYFCDGWSVFPIFQYLQGEIIYEHPGQNIVEANAKIKELFKGKIPSNVVCSIEVDK